MDGPIPFITVPLKDAAAADGKFTINPQAIRHLQQIKGPIGVITVAGMYRTGKSFILNRLAGSSKGFAIGGAVAELSNAIKISSSSSTSSPDLLQQAEDDGGAAAAVVNADLARFFPKFVWLVRDFTLKLEIEGKAVTAGEYLEHSLRPLQQLQDVRDDQLRPQFLEGLVEFTRLCFGKVCPKTMFGRVLDGGMFSELAQSYVNAFNNGGIPVIRSAWDQVLGAEARRAVDAAYEEYEEAWKKVLALTLSNTASTSSSPAKPSTKPTISKTVTTSTASLSGAAGTSPMIFEADQMEELHRKHAAKSMEVLRKGLKGVAAPYESEDRLMTQIQEHYALLKIGNIKRSNDLCERLMDEIAAWIDEKMNSGGGGKKERNGSTAGSTSMTMEEWEGMWQGAIAEKYLPHAKGPCKFEVLQNHVRKRGLATAGVVHRRIVESISKETQKKLEDQRESLNKGYAKLETLYKDMQAAWLKAREDLRGVEEENNKLIETVIKLSGVIEK
ncbi:hypothetical protein HK102_011132 [Quaeritorhiza haematococci]|nr:hypothetical protein HK102_011132 [Quaeritorhiza haematococci]